MCPLERIKQWAMHCGHFVLDLFSPCTEVQRWVQLNAFDRLTVTQTGSSALSRCHAVSQGHVFQQDAVFQLWGH